MKNEIGEPRGPAFPGPWYDDPVELSKCLGDMTAFYGLVKARHEAHYVRNERLGDYVVLGGNFRLDTCGNLLQAGDKPSVDLVGYEHAILLEDYVNAVAAWDISAHPDLITHEESSAPGFKWSDHKHRPIPFSFSFGMPVSIPHRVDLVCPCCHQGWHTWNLDDVVKVRGSDAEGHIPLTNFVGQTAETIGSMVDCESDRSMRLVLLRSDRYIDLNVREGYQLPTNEKGWVEPREAVDYLAEANDEASFDVTRFFHRDCRRAFLRHTVEETFRRVVYGSGFKILTMFPVENRYRKSPDAEPWFEVGTQYGKILIGWRNSVINIDWSDFDKEIVKKSESLFAPEGVTFGNGYVHAWGWEKAAEYLRSLFLHCSGMVEFVDVWTPVVPKPRPKPGFFL